MNSTEPVDNSTVVPTTTTILTSTTLAPSTSTTLSSTNVPVTKVPDITSSTPLEIIIPSVVVPVVVIVVIIIIIICYCKHRTNKQPPKPLPDLSNPIFNEVGTEHNHTSVSQDNQINETSYNYVEPPCIPFVSRKEQNTIYVDMTNNNRNSVPNEVAPVPCMPSNGYVNVPKKLVVPDNSPNIYQNTGHMQLITEHNNDKNPQVVNQYANIDSENKNSSDRSGIIYENAKTPDSDAEDNQGEDYENAPLKIQDEDYENTPEKQNQEANLSLPSSTSAKHSPILNITPKQPPKLPKLPKMKPQPSPKSSPKPGLKQLSTPCLNNQEFYQNVSLNSSPMTPKKNSPRTCPAKYRGIQVMP